MSQVGDVAKAKSVKGRKLIGQILVEMGVVRQEQVQEALEIKRRKGGATGTVLVELGYCAEGDISTALAIQAGMQVVSIDELDIPPEVIQKVDGLMARTYRIVPVKFENNRLTVAIGDPENLRTLDDLHFLLGMELEGAVADPAAIQRALDKYYKEGGESIEEVMGELEGLDAQLFSPADDAAGSVDLADVRAMSESQPVKKLLNLVLLQAIRDKASDIHFEPFEDEFKIRYRIDGALYEMVPPPKPLGMALTSRIKVLASLNIAERRIAQDGRIGLNVAGNEVDLRVSILPTIYGESCVLRVLDRSNVSLDLDRLGLREDDLRLFRTWIHKPNGIVLVTGPTGSGKTTTLYSALNEINNPTDKIITTEDPVEYDLEGVVQVQVHPEYDVTFANCLRAILRQDPDIILVGEIRDLETAEISAQASLTGHIVFTTLHTNDAPSSIARLLDLGIEPYLLTATLEGIISQRLIRKICENCKEPYEPNEVQLRELDLTENNIKSKKFYYGRGCAKCNNTGYRGRIGIFEIMTLNDEIRDLIMNRASTNLLRVAAQKAGMKLLRYSGLAAIYDGITTIDEVVKETVMEA